MKECSFIARFNGKNTHEVGSCGSEIAGKQISQSASLQSLDVVGIQPQSLLPTLACFQAVPELEESDAANPIGIGRWPHLIRRLGPIERQPVTPEQCSLLSDGLHDIGPLRAGRQPQGKVTGRSTGVLVKQIRVFGQVHGILIGLAHRVLESIGVVYVRLGAGSQLINPLWGRLYSRYEIFGRRNTNCSKLRFHHLVVHALLHGLPVDVHRAVSGKYDAVALSHVHSDAVPEYGAQARKNLSQVVRRDLYRLQTEGKQTARFQTLLADLEVLASEKIADSGLPRIRWFGDDHVEFAVGGQQEVAAVVVFQAHQLTIFTVVG